MLSFRSALYMTFLIITVIPYSFGCILWSPLPLHWRYQLTKGWPKLAIWGAKFFCDIRWQYKGLENIPNGPIIILSKHQSAWETLFFPAYMPKDVCFVYKKELHFLPFFGWGLALLKMIAIDRKKSHDAFDQVVRRGKQCLAEGRWPLLFPEGTRVAPGKTSRFKLGGARLAVECQTGIIPVALNAGECWSKKAFIKKSGLITVSFGPIIPYVGQTAEEMNEQAQIWIEKEMRCLNPERYLSSNNQVEVSNKKIFPRRIFDLLTKKD